MAERRDAPITSLSLRLYEIRCDTLLLEELLRLQSLELETSKQGGYISIHLI